MRLARLADPEKFRRRESESKKRCKLQRKLGLPVARRGNQKGFSSEEERQAAVKAAQKRYQDKNRTELRVKWRSYRKKTLAAKAIAEGRPVGHVGALPKYTDEERLALRRKRSLEYWHKNPELKKALQRKNYLENKDAFRIRARNRRSRVRGVSGTHTQEDIDNLLKLQNGKCPFCLKKLGSYDVDHYIPIVLGGSNDKSNLRIMHPKCNGMKGAKHPIDFGLQHGLLCW